MKRAQAFAFWLRANGINAIAYHGRLEPDERTEIEQQFIDNKYFAKFNVDFNKYNSKNFDCYDNIVKEVVRELLRRVYLPIYIPLITLIACLIIIKSKNDFNYSRYKFILFIIGTLLIILSEISIKYVGNNTFKNAIFLRLPQKSKKYDFASIIIKTT